MDPLDGLRESIKQTATTLDAPEELESGPLQSILESKWSDTGHIFLRQVDPLPMMILAIAPIIGTGAVPYRG